METYSARLARELAAHARLTTDALPGRADGSPPTSLQLLVFGATVALRLILAREVADVTHVGDMASWPLALAARVRSRRTQIVLSAHGTDVSYPRRGGMRGWLYGSYLRLAGCLLPGAVVIANSEATAEAVRGFGFTRLAVVPLAADIKAETPPAEHGGHLLFVGRLTPLKGCAWFIRNVLPRLPRTMRLRVAGTVWNADEERALSDPRVTFLGLLHGEALQQEFRSALCVVIPNIDVPNGAFEGFGLTATEAAAAGGVTVAAYHSGLREALVDGVTGFHVPPGDAEAWANKIREIDDWSDTQRLEFVRGALKTSRRIYSWDRVTRETLAAYALARPGAS